MKGLARLGPAMMASVLLAALVGAPRAQADTENPFERARRAAESLNYTGDMTVRWVDQWGKPQAIPIQVSGGDGIVQLGKVDQARLDAAGGERWLYDNGQWDLVASPGLLGRVPEATKKYSFMNIDGKQVAGRPTDGVAIMAGNTVRERLYFDTATGMLIAREQLDHGSVIRTVSFSDVTFGGEPPRRPRAIADTRPKPLTRAGSPYRTPAALAAGYTRVEMLRRPTAVQVVYSDGVHSLSVFEQPGQVDHRSLPPEGRPVSLGKMAAVQLAWSGGQVVVWQGGQVVYTLVGDGDPADVLAAARSLPVSHPSFWDRVKNRSERLLRGLAAR